MHKQVFKFLIFFWVKVTVDSTEKLESEPIHHPLHHTCDMIGYLASNQPQNVMETLDQPPLNYFFVHIAKAGGTTFSLKLAMIFGELSKLGNRRFSHMAEAYDLDKNLKFPVGENLTSTPVPNVSYVWLEGLSGNDERTGRAQFISAERDASWRPYSRIPQHRLVLLRRPICRVNSHFYHHIQKHRINMPNQFQKKCGEFKSASDYLERCCLSDLELEKQKAVLSKCGKLSNISYTQFQKELCHVNCRQFRNFQSFMLLGSGRSGLATWEQNWTPLHGQEVCDVPALGLSNVSEINPSQIVSAALASLSQFEFIGVTEFMDISLCLFYFTFNFTQVFDSECRKRVEHDEKINRGHYATVKEMVDCSDPTLAPNLVVAHANKMDLIVYDAALDHFRKKVQRMELLTGLHFPTEFTPAPTVAPTCDSPATLLDPLFQWFRHVVPFNTLF